MAGKNQGSARQMQGNKAGTTSQTQGKRVTFIYAGARGVGLESALSFYETAVKAGFCPRLVLSSDNARRELVQKVYPEAKFINFLSPREVLSEARELNGGVAFFTMLSPKMFPLFFAARARKIFCFHSQYDKSLIEPKSRTSDRLLDTFHYLAIRNADLVAVINPYAYWQLKLRFGKEAHVLSHPPFSVLREGMFGERKEMPLPFANGSYFLHFGRIDEFAKGTMLLLKAVEGTVIPTVLLGRASMSIEGKNIAHISRWLSDGELQCLLSGARCVVAPYLAASQFSSVAALAFRSKKPVLAPLSPGFDGWVEEGETGWFFQQGSWQDLRKKMQAVNDGHLRFSEKAIAAKELEMEAKAVRLMRELLDAACR